MGAGALAYDHGLFSDWFFVTLTAVGQVVAVKIGSPSTQNVVLRISNAYEPLEHELAEAP